MLRAILDAMARGQVRSHGELTAALGVPAAAIQRGLAILEQRGYLQRRVLAADLQVEGGSPCHSCPLRSVCSPAAGCAVAAAPATVYQLTEKGRSAARAPSVGGTGTLP